jgi:hypothetical protein
MFLLPSTDVKVQFLKFLRHTHPLRKGILDKMSDNIYKV